MSLPTKRDEQAVFVSRFLISNRIEHEVVFPTYYYSIKVKPADGWPGYSDRHGGIVVAELRFHPDEQHWSTNGLTYTKFESALDNFLRSIAEVRLWEEKWDRRAEWVDDRRKELGL